MAIPLPWPVTETIWQRFVRETGLTPEAAARALYLGYWVKRLGGLTIQINSAYRSPAYQKQLQAQWDRGNRAGLKVRPADSSRHTEGRAFDVSVQGPEPSKATWENIGRVGETLGLRWGGRFSPPDPVHFDY